MYGKCQQQLYPLLWHCVYMYVLTIYFHLCIINVKSVTCIFIIIKESPENEILKLCCCCTMYKMLYGKLVFKLGLKQHLMQFNSITESSYHILSHFLQQCNIQGISLLYMRICIHAVYAKGYRVHGRIRMDICATANSGPHPWNWIQLNAISVGHRYLKNISNCGVNLSRKLFGVWNMKIYDWMN